MSCSQIKHILLVIFMCVDVKTDMFYVMFLCFSVRHVGYDISGFYVVCNVFVLFSQTCWL